MAMYELDGNHLLPVRLGRSADAITLSHSLVAIQRQIVDVLRRPLFPLSWEELETGASLTALDATGQVVVVEVLERVDSTGLLAAMSRLTQAATAGRREIASRYAGGLGAFSQDWNEFREAMPAQVEAGPRLTILSASLEPTSSEGWEYWPPPGWRSTRWTCASWTSPASSSWWRRSPGWTWPPGGRCSWPVLPGQPWPVPPPPARTVHGAWTPLSRPST